MSVDETDGARMRAAIEALTQPGRFEEAENRVARAAPDLQRLLSSILAEGGWFEASHDDHVRQMASITDVEERITALRTLLAEETRVGMMVGVAVGWELARELGESAEGSAGSR